MDKNDEKKSSFPDGYERIEERLKQTKERLEEIDRQIKTGAPDRGPEPALRPPSTTSNPRKGNNERKIAFLKDQQDQMREDTWEKIEAETRNGDPKTVRIVRDRAREEMFPNRFLHMNKSERMQESDRDNDFNTLQDRFDAVLVESAIKRNKEPEPDKETPEREDTAPLSASERFSRTLAYTRFVEQGREMVEPDVDPGIEKD
ncbi:hypothetical protein [Spirosoma lituiforme]